ncbi:hypothetical protein [Actinoallomurus sp. NPDC052274]
MHAKVTVPAPLVLGLIGATVLASVIAVVQWRRAREAEQKRESPAPWRTR